MGTLLLVAVRFILAETRKESIDTVHRKITGFYLLKILKKSRKISLRDP